MCHTFNEEHTFTWHMHSFLAKDSNFFPREIEHCADPPEVSLGYLVEPTTCAGYEPKDLAGNEDFRVKPLFFHRPSIASTYDSCSDCFTTVPAGAISKCVPIASLSLCKRKLDVKFISRSEEYRENRRVVFKQKQVESRNLFRQRRFSSGHQQVMGNNELLFRFSHPANSVKSLLRGIQRLHACGSKI